MSKVLKYFPLIGLIFLIIHFAISFAYVLPQGMVNEKIQAKSTAYTLPFFQQYWNLFSPAPTVNKTFIYRAYSNEGEKSKWLSPYNEALANHYSNRLSPSGREVILYSNLLYYLIIETCPCNTKRSSVFIGDTATSSFNALRYLIEKKEVKAKYADIIVICSQPKTPWQKQSFNHFSIVYSHIKLRKQ